MSRSILLIVAVFVALLAAWYFLMGPGMDADTAAPIDPPAVIEPETPAVPATGN